MTYPLGPRDPDSSPVVFILRDARGMGAQGVFSRSRTARVVQHEDDWGRVSLSWPVLDRPRQNTVMPRYLATTALIHEIETSWYPGIYVGRVTAIIPTRNTSHAFVLFVEILICVSLGY